jgi:hypothetical protein
MKRFITFALLALALLAIPQQADARVFGGFRGVRSFNRGFYGNNFGYGFSGYNNFAFASYASFAYVQPVAVIQYVQYVPVQTVAVQQVAYSAPVVQQVALAVEAQPVYALPVFQQVYQAQQVYSTPYAFANACYSSPLLFNAHFGRHGLNHSGVVGGHRR